MKIYFTLLFLPLILSYTNSAGQDNTSYLLDHATDITRGISTTQITNPLFFNNQLFLLGEIHGIQKGQDGDYGLVTLLNQKIKLNTYVAEFDFAKAYFLNQYLNTGDEGLMDAVFQDWIKQDAQWANQDFQRKIRKLRAYNQNLKPDQRIYFEGIDQIQNPALVARYLNILFKDPSLHKVHSSFRGLITALAAKNDSLIIALSSQLQTDAGINSLHIEPSKLAELKYVLSNCKSIKSSREGVLYDNFSDLFKMRNWGNKKLYGFFGFAHILQSVGNQGKFKSLAVRLEEDPNLQLKGNVVSIAMLYLDSKMMMPTSGLPAAWQNKTKRFSSVNQFNHDGPLVKFDGIEVFKSNTKPNSTTLFYLRENGSPFLKTRANIIYADMMPQGQRLMLDEKDKFITDYFQYIVLVRNSDATLPVKGD